MTDLYTHLVQLATTEALPEHDALFAAVSHALSVLENADVCTPLLDFTRQEQKPLIVVPDLHARRDFLRNVLDFVLPQQAGADSSTAGETVLSLLERGAVRVVCVGDLFHSERRCYERWLVSYDEYERGEVRGKAISAEMVENLTLLEMIAALQSAFPQNFVFLKGNHENILNENSNGDYSFRKFVAEGAQVLAFMRAQYDEALLHVIRQWELSLPLCAAFSSCVVSHAEPIRAFSKKELMRGGSEIVHGLTWTRNDEAEYGSVEKTMQQLLGKAQTAHAVWLSGHRPVQERYALRQNGKLVQIHNPWKQQVALVFPEQQFNPETDIVDVAEV